MYKEPDETENSTANETPQFYIPFRAIWNGIAMTDAGAFHVTLGNTVTHWQSLIDSQNSQHQEEASAHYVNSLAKLRQRLDDASELGKAGTVANILAHVCLTVRDSSFFLFYTQPSSSYVSSFSAGTFSIPSSFKLLL